MQLQEVFDGLVPTPTPFAWRYGKSTVRVNKFDQVQVWIENKSGETAVKSRFHCAVHFKPVAAPDRAPEE